MGQGRCPGCWPQAQAPLHPQMIPSRCSRLPRARLSADQAWYSMLLLRQPICHTLPPRRSCPRLLRRMSVCGTRRDRLHLPMHQGGDPALTRPPRSPTTLGLCQACQPQLHGGTRIHDGLPRALREESTLDSQRQSGSPPELHHFFPRTLMSTGMAARAEKSNPYRVTPLSLRPPCLPVLRLLGHGGSVALRNQPSTWPRTW